MPGTAGAEGVLEREDLREARPGQSGDDLLREGAGDQEHLRRGRRSALPARARLPAARGAGGGAADLGAADRVDVPRPSGGGRGSAPHAGGGDAGAGAPPRSGPGRRGERAVKRIGFLGGSFDPLHLGHLWIALLAREQLSLDLVLLVPASVPPHKGTGTSAPYRFRLGLAERVAAQREGLVASSLESEQDRPSYTVDSLTRLRRELGGEAEVWLLLGSDSLEELPMWKRPERIAELARLAVYDRPGHQGSASARYPTDRIEGPVCTLSSTWIRDRLRGGRSVAGFVPDEILSEVEGCPHYRGSSG
ncbi:MAG: nicotinate (nicotinamide) nucleotide adenylyltransferase [Candidatus Eisenbacteria bacterium]|nr:nicotinate (nicotinamide) nucleotide adenylyltransferase [Candidatus Latescibacterota bacterium]MBD3303174.1 nicotinate (nicotinamide) nucleotide adenylyltransferase [Candidatus Eisenbacteria bacterium]